MNPMELRQLREEMCEVGRRIWLNGFCAGNEGNHSVRIGEDRFLCTPTGMSKGFLSPEDLCVVDGAGRQVERNPRGRTPTSEVLVHLAVYRQRTDVNAVVHSHPPHATAFAIAGMPVPEGIYPEAEVFLGKVQTAPYAPLSTARLPESIIPLIRPDTTSLLMSNHGSLSFSTSLMDAYYKLEILDAYCRILLLSRELGPPKMLRQEQMAELLTIKQKFGQTDHRTPDSRFDLDNQPFITSFDVRPTSATCSGTGNDVQTRSRSTVQTTHAVEPNPISPNRDQTFEYLVQAITDQIMAAGK